jgi:carbonic anhydrase
MRSGTLLLSLLYAGLLAITSGGCSDTAATTDPHAVDTTHTTCTHFEYSGTEGPEHWKDCDNYKDCGGTVQSPINITAATTDAALGDITFTYDSSKTSVLNNGHTLQWAYDAGSSITFGGTKYQLLQYHFHSASEHTINGASFPLEVHLVHKDTVSGKLAVIGVIFNEGAENPLLAKFMASFPTAANATYDNAMRYIASDLLPAGRGYYTYGGSLTTPPCSEIVTWIVMKDQITASKAQIDAMKAIMHTNNRPVQSLNGRQIKMH